MSQSQAESTVSVPADQLFEYLAQVSNLPEYFPAMKSATAVDGGDKVDTVAVTDDGTRHEGEAWFRIDHDERTIEWGSESDSQYHGELSVASNDDDSAQVSITLNTERAEQADLDDGLQEVLDKIKEIVESR